MTEKKQKLLIVGHSETSRQLAPHQDKTFDVWACNQLGIFMPDLRVDVYWDLHRPRENAIDRWKWQAQQPQPVWVHPDYPIDGDGTYPALPTAKPFPFERMFQEFGPYFGSSIAYQLMYGVLEGYKEIHIYGVDLAMRDEYEHQRPNMEYWIGMCRGLGIDVVVPPQCLMLRCDHRYGYDQPPESEGVVTEGLCNERLRVIRARKQQCEAEIHNLNGAEAQIIFFLRRIQFWKRDNGLMFRQDTENPAGAQHEDIGLLPITKSAPPEVQQELGRNGKAKEEAKKAEIVDAVDKA